MLSAHLLGRVCMAQHVRTVTGLCSAAGIKTEPVEQGPAQEQHAWTLDVKLEPTEASSSSTCACGLPGVPCKAHGCSALYCQPCDRKCKEADTFAGFQSCSSGCCRKVRYCEQHRNMLKRCHVCEELCCMRASCQRCTNIVCVSCKASHTRAGCAA